MPNQPLFDGFTALADGMNESRKATIIGPTQYARGVNVTVRGGFVHTRPAFIREYVDGMPTDATFQGAGVWRLDAGEYLVFVASGILYTIAVNTNTLVSHGLLFDTEAVCYFEQVDRYFMVQDGVNNPQVLEEVSGTPGLTSETVDVPIGTIMQFAHGRLHSRTNVVPGTTLNGKPYFVSGDILTPLNPANVFQTTETEYLSGGGAHALPLEMGYITAMGVLRNAQTGTGLGELIVFGKHGVCAYDMSLPRSLWQDQQLSRVLFFGPGCQSPRSVVPVNDDLAYRALDGLRLLRYTVSRASGSTGSLSNVPMSREVYTWLERTDLDYLDFIASTFYDNRFLITATGTNGRYFKGLVSMDAAVIYDKGGAASPAYDGIWTGLNFGQPLMALRDDKEVCFVFTEGPYLYRIDETEVQDEYALPEEWDYDVEAEPTDEQLATLDDGKSKIESILITKVFNGESLLDRKVLKFVEFWISELKISTDVEVYYKPMYYPLWTQLGTAKTLEVGDGSLPQRRRKLRFALDPTTEMCDPTIKETLWSAYGFQIAIKWTGNMEINSFRIAMDAVPEPNPDQCAAEDPVVLEASDTAGTSITDYEYVIGSDS